MQDYLVELGFVDLSDLYLTKAEYDKAIRRMRRRIRNCTASTFWLSLGLGSLAGCVYILEKRIATLERKIREKDETAG